MKEYVIIVLGNVRLIDISTSELVKLLHVSFVDANQCTNPLAKLGAS